MHSLTFSPKQSTDGKPDTVANLLYTVSTYIFVVALGILPVAFLPLAAAPLGYSKTFLVLAAIFVSLIFYGLAVLRSGTLHLQITIPALIFWFVLIATAISALFSGDIVDGFIGVAATSQTVVFIGALALVMTACHLFLHNKTVMMHLYLGLYASAVLLGLYQLIRLIFGPEVLSFGLVSSDIFTPIGNWNDLAIFFGLMIILSLVVLEQLTLSRPARYIFGGMAGLSIILLVVVQFTVVWMILGFIALIGLMFSLTRHRFNPDYNSRSSLSPILSGLVALLALLFLLGGSTLSNSINNLTGIEYLEVRPTAMATVDIAQGVYAENALLGVGPNKFIDAWRLHRDQSLNNTVFWNTDFTAGNSYLNTMLTTSGLLAALVWIGFFISFLFIGYRMFLQNQKHDPFWHFIATSSYTAALYLWIIAAIYVPGPAILLITALCTGIALVSYCNLCTVPVLRFDSTQNRQATAVLIAGVLLLIITSVSATYKLSTHYAALLTFNTAFAADTVERSNQIIEQAYERFPHESFARQRALNAILTLNQLIRLSDPDDDARAAFEQALVSGVQAAQESTRRDPTNAQNWAVQAALYSTLIAADIEGAASRAYDSITTAQQLYPTNPEYVALEAQIAFRANDPERARQAIERSLQLKPDYMAALSLLTEIEILTGNIETAIATAQAMTRLQPNNAALRYQLAILYLAEEQQISAVGALEQAISIDPDFANARYVLALQLAELERRSEALTQLRYVLDLNPGNEDVIDLIARIEAGESIDAQAATPPAEEIDGTLTGTEQDPTQSDPAPDSDLLQSVNVSPDSAPTPTGGETTLEAPAASED